MPHSTVAPLEDRIALGRAARLRVPRSAQARVELTEDRDPIATLRAQAASRVPELVPIRYARMAAGPFAFFRGAAAIMAADLAGTPTSGLTVQLCGDAHAANFGLFASPERQLVFDINDFDETLPGPWEWDVKRLAASLQVAAEENGVDADQRSEIVRGAIRRYRDAMIEFAGLGNLAVWYANLPAETSLHGAELDRATARLAARTVSKAKTRDHVRSYARFIHDDGDEIHFVSQPPLLVRLADLTDVSALQERLVQAFADYRESLAADRRTLLDQYRPVELARKVVGVGSVGTQAWVLLLVGRSNADPLFLQIKQAQASVLERHLGPSRYDNAGHRVVAGQRHMQASSDILLGWNRMLGSDDVGRDFYVRQLHDWKGSADIEALSPTGLRSYGELCGWTLARAHARSGDRVAIAAYLGRGPGFERAVAEFAAGYAELNRLDHARLVAAIAAGELPAEPA